MNGRLQRYRIRLRGGRSVFAVDAQPQPYGHLRARVERWRWVEHSPNTMCREPRPPRTVTYAAGQWTSFEEVE